MIQRLGPGTLVAVAAGLLLVAGTSAALVTEPAAHWAFDEAAGAVAVDGIGTLDGTIDGALRIPDGASRGALRFDGSSRVVVPNDPLLRGPAITVTLRVRGDPASPPADGEVVLERGDIDCRGGSYALIVDGGHVALRYREAATPGEIRTITLDTAAGLPSLWDGAWHQVAFSNQDGEWGSIGLYQQGWMVGVGDISRGLVHDGLDVADLVIGGPAGAACGTPGFTGDIDEVVVYPGVVARDTLVAQEPIVETTLEIVDFGPLAVDVSGTMHVRVGPAPLAPGRLWAYLTGEDGIERVVGATPIDWPWTLPADGVFGIAVRPEDGGAGTIRVRYEAELPSLSSEGSTTVTVAKASSSTHIGLRNTYIEEEPIRLAVNVSTGAYVKVNGTVEVYERTPGAPVLLATAPVVSPVGSFNAGAELTLPPRPAGEYRFEARFLGGTAHLASTSVEAILVVEPALAPGPLAINGGAETTDDPVVTVSTPATGAVAMQVARSLDTLQGQDPPIPYAPSTATWLTAAWYGDDADGVRTIWVRYADALGRWGDWLADSIVLDRGVPRGTVAIDGGAALTGSVGVTVDVPIADPDGVAGLELSNDGRTWTSMAYAPAVSWTLAGEGERTVHVRWKDVAGRQSAPVTDSIIVDLSAPVVGPVRVGVNAGGRPTATIPVRLSWSAADPAGVRAFDVLLRKDDGSWAWIADDTGSTSVARRLEPGHRYQLRVRATDGLGNRSAWTTGPAFRVHARQESSPLIRYRGTWSRSWSTEYWGGATRYSRTSSASATLDFRGYAVAWVSAVGPGRGSARVYLDGVLVETVNLWAPSTSAPRVVFQRSWPSTAAHTIRVVVRGTSGHPRVDVDGLVVLAPG